MTPNRLVYSVLCAFLVLGCAKDRTVLEHQQKQNEEELAKIREISGTYRGSLVSNGIRVAALTLELDGATRSVPGGQTLSGQQVVLTGAVKIESGAGYSDTRFLSFREGSYYAATRRFSASVPVGSSARATIELAGNIASGVATGKIEAGGYSRYGGQFTLVKDGNLPPANSLQTRAIPAAGMLQFSRLYVGSADFGPGSPPAAASLSIYNVSQGDSDVNFYEFFLPTKKVDVTVTLGSGASMTFAGAQIETQQTTPVLVGHANASSSTGGYNVSLKCTSMVTASGLYGWDCFYYRGRETDGPYSFEMKLEPK